MTCGRPICLGVLTLFVLGLAATQAAAWGPAVHVYVADHTGKLWPFLNRTEMYGSTLPDMCYFAYSKGPVFQATCAGVIHDYSYMAMWDGAFNLQTVALGYGYESHHEADITAHQAGILVGRNEGYVIQKAEILAGVLWPELQKLGLDYGQVQAIAHNLIEVGTDVLVKRVDPLIGSKLTLAALLRGPFVPQQLGAVYAGELAFQLGTPWTPAEAASELAEAEIEFRIAMVVYGLALMKDEDAAILTLAQQFAAIASNWGVDPETPGLTSLIENAIKAAVALCEPDLRLELAATTWAVRVRLWQQGVAY